MDRQIGTDGYVMTDMDRGGTDRYRETGLKRRDTVKGDAERQMQTDMLKRQIQTGRCRQTDTCRYIQTDRYSQKDMDGGEMD